MDFALSVITINGLIDHSLVDKVAEKMMLAPDGMNFFQYSKPVFQFIDTFPQILIAHDRFPLSAKQK